MALFRRFGLMLISLALFFLTILGMKSMTEIISNHLWLNQSGMIEAIGKGAHWETLMGNILQSKALATTDIVPFYGSSELGTGFEFNPTNVFGRRQTGFVPFIIGRGSVQSLVNILNLAGQDHLQGRKLILSFSPDWFAERKGLENKSLAMNSSKLHIYQMMLSPSFPPDLKREVAQRILEMPEVMKDDPLLKSYLQAYTTSGYWAKSKVLWYWPMAELQCAALEVQDVLSVRDLVKKVKPYDFIQVTKEKSKVSWNTLLKRSELRGKSLISNDLNILDALYPKYMKPGMKDSWSRLKLYPSKEYDDFNLMLRVLKEKGAKPLFVIIPANGRWADYVGFSPQERKDYYRRIRLMIKDNGFSVADFSAKEYEPYFMQDPWHIGLKGWAEVDSAINKFVHST
ncbi:MAG: D-alanyl-lipoteichoic acid biosynthesis protein DltD [Desulfosporosinus sp.]|nr:D-alanyl-lipoteichoic acid biosynthesis protein DltD [Desulfosporosinus sp.]